MFKESFRAWYKETDRNRAGERLESLEEKIANDSLPEFKELLHTLGNWGEEILISRGERGGFHITSPDKHPYDVQFAQP